MKTVFTETETLYTITLTDPDPNVPVVSLVFDFAVGDVYFTISKSGKLNAIGLTRQQTLISIGVTYSNLVSRVIADMSTPDSWFLFWHKLKSEAR